MGTGGSFWWRFLKKYSEAVLVERSLKCDQFAEENIECLLHASRIKNCISDRFEGVGRLATGRNLNGVWTQFVHIQF